VSNPVFLINASTTISIVVVSPDMKGSQTYTVTVARPHPVLTFTVSEGKLDSTLVNQNSLPSFTDTVANSVSSITVTPTLSDSQATVSVNGVKVVSGTPSAPITLAVGTNSIDVSVSTSTAGFGELITVTRAAAPVNSFDAGFSVSKPKEAPILVDDGIVVHQAISPNGDGINDFLVIENISQYPDNKLTIVNRSGQQVFETKGYDNTSKVFDGHGKNGQMQLPGTYFYQLDYTVSGIIKHKTGYLVLKY
jgi:gliding motility-associated-like protein